MGIVQLSIPYRFVIDGRAVIALPAVGSRFWENWCLAHELGHLVLGHSVSEFCKDGIRLESSLCLLPVIVRRNSVPVVS